MRLAPRLAFGLALLLPLSGHAQGVSAESARSIWDQLHAWIAGLLGPSIDPALLTPKVVAQDDHYDLSLAIPGLVGDDTATARLLPLDHDRWSLQAIQFPANMHYNMRLPEPGPTPAMGSTAFTLTIGSQDSHALFDPSFNSRSELSLDLHGLTSRADGPQGRQEQHIGELRQELSLQPNAAGSLDFNQASTITAWSTVTQAQGKPALDLSADRITARGQIAGLSREQAGMLLSAASGLLATLPAKEAAQGKAKLSPAGHTALRQLVGSLRGIFTSMRGEDDIDGLHFQAAGMAEGSIRHIHIGMGGDAPNGMLHGWLDIAFDGLSIPTLPAEMASLMPNHVVLRPSLSGVPADAVMQLAMDATAPDANQAELTAEATTLVRKGTTVALEKIGFEVGPAVVQGTGHLTVTGPDEYAGEAHLVATGFDALIDRARTDPTLQRGMAVLIMLRGYARSEGNHLVWNVEAQGGGVSVNGIPLIPPHEAGAGHPGMPRDNQK